MSKTVSKTAQQGTLRSYVAGFILSLVLTIEAYLLVAHHSFSAGTLMALVVAFALVQLVVQLIFFLHIDRESKPRWNLTVLLFAVLVVVIIVFGSLWIMQNLNYHHGHGEIMTPQEIIQDEGFQEHTH